VRIMAGDTTERPGALRVAPGLRDPDGLESRQLRVFWANHARNRPRRMAVTLTAERQLRFGGPVVVAERHAEIVPPGSRGRDMCPRGTVASLARDVGDQEADVKCLAASRESCRVAPEALERYPGRQFSSTQRGSGRRPFGPLARCEPQGIGRRVMGDAVFQSSRCRKVGERHKRSRVVARTEGVVNHEPLDGARFRPHYTKVAVAQGVRPGDTLPLRIRDAAAVERSRPWQFGGRMKGLCVARPSVMRELARVALSADSRADVWTRRLGA
jgi:hypothetical protein